MKYARMNNHAIAARADGPKQARCIYCSEWVNLDYGPGMTAPGWFHQNDNAAILCSRERAIAQAELYQAIGVEK